MPERLPIVDLESATFSPALCSIDQKFFGESISDRLEETGSNQMQSNLKCSSLDSLARRREFGKHELRAFEIAR
jgi:hypothetical protein